MSSLEAVADRIFHAGLPALFLDTCIPLDIIRSPLRESPGLVRCSIELLEMVSASPPRSLLVLPSIVPEEWEANFRNVAREVIAHLRALDQHSMRFHEVREALGIDATFGRATYANVGVADKLLELAECLLGGAIRIDEDPACVVKAYGRVKRRAPPSSSGSDVKDSTIVEECLAICRHLQSVNHRAPMVFCTSNVKDFCDKERRLHANLAAEFDEVGLKFSMKLPWALRDSTQHPGPVPGESTSPDNLAGGGQT